MPGDGINVLYTLLLGLNRARYLMLTGQVLEAQEAKALGLVAELMPREKLLPRAWETQHLAKKPDMLLRYARAVLTHPLRKALEDGMRTTSRWKRSPRWTRPKALRNEERTTFLARVRMG